MMACICVVDDQAVMRDSITDALERAGHRVTAFADPARALESVLATPFDLVLTDLKMPGMDGLSLIRAIRSGKCDTPVIVMTAYGSVPAAVEAMRLGAFDFIQKPFEAEGLDLQVERALRHQRLCTENEALRVSLDDARKNREMVGAGEAMQRVREKIRQFGHSAATVLISGESGTGKELAASAIHVASARRDRPMLCVNCAALSANLLESELFGHERGAFTGADRLRRGRFELAGGGTLLLDEVSEMALPLQAKLLRVLQEGEFERVGSSTPRRADVRVIATTNRTLEDWVAKKRFREDLYYRLNVLPLHLPPLKARREDIPAIVEHVLSRLARGNGATPPAVTPDAMAALRSYDWPGNVRELENVCQRVVATFSGEEIEREQVEQWLRGTSSRTEVRGGTERCVSHDADAGFVHLRPGRMLQDMERRLIERTLKQYNGHRVNSARALGMGVRTLGLKLKQWREQDASAAERDAAVVGA